MVVSPAHGHFSSSLSATYPFSCNVGVSLTLKTLFQDVFIYSLFFSTSLKAGVSGGIKSKFLCRIEVWPIPSWLPIARQSVRVAPRITRPRKSPSVKTWHFQRPISRSNSQWQIQAQQSPSRGGD